MREKKTVYNAYCDACHKKIEDKIYQEKDDEGKLGDLCRRCYINHFGSTWDFIWFKIHNWVFGISAVAVSFLIFRLEGGDIYYFWGSLVFILFVWYGLNDVNKYYHRRERMRQDEEFKERKNPR